METSSQNTPDLKWQKRGIFGRGKAAAIFRVRNTVTKEPQTWKWIHEPNLAGSGEHRVLNMLQGRDNIQKVFHGDESNDVIVLKFAKGGDLHSYGLDNFGATRQLMPEIFLWHFQRSMAAALAYCQAGLEIWRAFCCPSRMATNHPSSHHLGKYTLAMATVRIIASTDSH
jgi:hypothetical protein